MSEAGFHSSTAHTFREGQHEDGNALLLSAKPEPGDEVIAHVAVSNTPVEGIIDFNRKHLYQNGDLWRFHITSIETGERIQIRPRDLVGIQVKNIEVPPSLSPRKISDYISSMRKQRMMYVWQMDGTIKLRESGAEPGQRVKIKKRTAPGEKNITYVGKINFDINFLNRREGLWWVYVTDNNGKETKINTKSILSVEVI